MYLRCFLPSGEKQIIDMSLFDIDNIKSAAWKHSTVILASSPPSYVEHGQPTAGQVSNLRKVIVGPDSAKNIILAYCFVYI